MEDVVDVYEWSYNAECPVVCMAEKPYQLLGKTREPLPMLLGSADVMYPEAEKCACHGQS
jgi:hypothetical protein